MMSETNFDEQLDLALQRRAQSEIPESLAEHVDGALARERTRSIGRMWWRSAVAACLLLSVFVAYRTHTHNQASPKVTARIPASLHQVETGAHHLDASTMVSSRSLSPKIHRGSRWAQSNLDAGASASDTTALGNTSVAPGNVLDTRPQYLRMAQQTAACAMIPCSCKEMCRVSIN
jgi:hypothetical protein